MNVDKEVLWSVDQGIGRLTFNRPDQANSLGRSSRTDLGEGVSRMAEADVRVVVITGRGKFFCSGGNIDEFHEHQDTLDHLLDEDLKFCHPMLHRLATLPVPVISAVNGPLGGAGIGFALCADFVLASDTIKLRGGYCRIGLSPDMGSSYFLTRRVGAARAMEIFMLNRALSAEDCLRLRIVDHVFPEDQLGAAAEKLARELACGPTSSFGCVKKLCGSAFSHDLQAHLDLERELLLQCAKSADGREGIASFIDGRAPRFCGS